MEEYYETMLAFAKEYIASGMKMDVDIWQFLRLYPETESFRIVPVACAEGEYRPTFPGCRGNRGMVAVTSSGEIVPCIQFSGTLQKTGVFFGNLHEKRLKDLLISGSYLENVCDTVGSVRENNPKCGGCKWFVYCTGGCRAMGYLYSGERKDFYGEDLTKCRFFENGWYEKVRDAYLDSKKEMCVRDLSNISTVTSRELITTPWFWQYAKEHAGDMTRDLTAEEIAFSQSEETQRAFMDFLEGRRSDFETCEPELQFLIARYCFQALAMDTDYFVRKFGYADISFMEFSTDGAAYLYLLCNPQEPDPMAAATLDEYYTTLSYAECFRSLDYPASAHEAVQEIQGWEEYFYHAEEAGMKSGGEIPPLFARFGIPG